MSGNVPQDDSYAKGLVVLSNDGQKTSVILQGDPATKRLLVNATLSGSALTNTPMATRTDSATTTNVTYVGKAAIGTATSAALWQVFKMDETTANTLIITWAGTASFDQIWDNRASLSYS